jgi:hypothetical protein
MGDIANMLIAKHESYQTNKKDNYPYFTVNSIKNQVSEDEEVRKDVVVGQGEPESV